MSKTPPTPAAADTATDTASTESRDQAGANESVVENGSASQLEAIRETIIAGTPAPVKVRIGDAMRLTSKFGPMEHPFTGTKFGVDGGKKVQVDAWVKLQVEAGKLVEEAD